MAISKSISGAKKKIDDYTKDLKNRHQNGINAAARTFEDNRRSGNYWRSVHASNYTSPYGAGSSTMGQPKGGAKYGSQVGIAGGVNKTASNTPDYTDLRNVAKPEYTDPRTLERPEFEQGTAFNANVDKTNVNKWRDTLEEMYDQIVNRDPFNYDQNKDPLYQQYQDMYTRNAKLAMQDTVGQIAALTGGYGSSYAETAGQAMYNQAMNGLNERAIELYGLAQDRYNQETNRLQQNFNNAGNMYNQAYGEMRDDMSDQRYAYELAEEQRRERNANALQMYDYDRQDLAAMNDYNLQMYNYDLQNAAAMNDYNLNLWDANNSNNQWAQEFAYQQQQDAWDNQFRQNQFDWDKYTYNNDFNYQRQQDAINNQFRQNQFDRSVYESDRDFDRGTYESDRNFNYGAYNDWRDNQYRYDAMNADNDYRDRALEQDARESQLTREYNSRQSQLDREHEMKKLNTQIEADGYEKAYKDLANAADPDNIAKGNTKNANNAMEFTDSRSGGKYKFGAESESSFNRNAYLKSKYGSYQKYVDTMLDKNKTLTENEKLYILSQLTT